MRNMQKSAVLSSAAIVAGMLWSQHVWAGVSPVVVQSWETGTNIPTGTDVGWYGNVPNAPFTTDGTPTTNVGWQVPGGGVATNPADTLSVLTGTPGNPAVGATDGLNSLQVTTPAISGGFTRGAQYEVNSSYGAFWQGMDSSNEVEFDITVTTPQNLGVNLSMAFQGLDGSNNFIDGFNDSDNRALSDPGFSSTGTAGTHTSIWNYGAVIQDFYQVGLINSFNFFSRLDLSTNTQGPNSSTFEIDNLRFVSRAITWNGGGADNNLSTTANWTGVTSEDDSGELENQQGDSATNHPELNDALHFAGTTNTTVNNNMGSFAAAITTQNGGYAPNSQFGGLVFDAGAGPFTINGNPIDLAGDDITDPTTSGDIINNSTSLQTINVPIRLLSNVTIKDNTGTLLFSQPISQLVLPASFNAPTSYGVTFAGAGQITLSAVNTWTSFTNVFNILTISATGSIATTGNLVGAGGTMNVIGSIPATSNMTVNGTLNFSNPGTGIQARNLASLTIGATGLTAIALPSAIGNRIVLATSALTITAGGKLDLGANDMIVRAAGEAGYGTINSEVAQGRGTNGAWTSAGITSSAAALAPGKFALGAIVNDTNQTPAGALSGVPLKSTFDGQSVADGDVLVKYTYAGDANLDGVVNAADYLQIDSNFTGGGTLKGWFNGDFNYDGVVNGDDYTLIDNAFNTQGGVSLSAISVGPAELIASDTEQVAIPEPASLSLIGLAAGGLLMRRRRRI
jgi:hypothetical protein